MKATFLHIPKTGGNTIRKLFKELEGFQAIDHNRQHPFYKGEIPAMQDELGFIFTFVRNPFDRVVSAFFHGSAKNTFNRDFEAFVLDRHGLQLSIEQDKLIFRPQSIWLEGINLDFLGKFESFETDIRMFCNKIGWEPPEEIPQMNKSKHRPYWEYYDDLFIQDRVYYFYHRDFEELGYSTLPVSPNNQPESDSTGLDTLNWQEV